MKAIAKVLFLGLLILPLAGCGKSEDGRVGTSQTAAADFRVVSGSENKALEPILQRFGQERGFQIHVDYKGSVDIMLELEKGSSMPYDAIWPANSLWITLGDVQKVVKHEESVMHSPVVFGVKRSLAKQLGWLDRDIKIADVLQAAENGEFSFAMTSATQSNSGASAYLGFLHAMAGAPDVLSGDHLSDPQVQDKTRRLLKQIDRSSGSSGWLKDMVVENYDKFQAMVNYESMIIEANRELETHGKEPLVAIYPTDAIMLADSPLGFVDHGDAKKEEFFRGLVEYLKSEPVQNEIMQLGRRTGVVGFDTNSVDTTVFNPAWGIDVSRVISPVPTPSEPVIREALYLYQSGGLRKPSTTVYVLDCSGSMRGSGIKDLKRAMSLLLDPGKSKRYLLQPSPEDVHILIPFDGMPRKVTQEQGNDAETLNRLLTTVEGLRAQGGTNMYAALLRGLDELEKLGDLEQSFPALILMTDGKSQGNLSDIAERVRSRAEGPALPVFSITFGEADDRQLQQVSQLTGGRVFDGKKDLSKAFRKAKGYN
jgi:Ca-activated chloride channel family protein